MLNNGVPLNNEEVNENIFAGIVGAFLFSLAGGILWYVLYQVGFLAGISGVVGIFAAVRGYSFFAKKQSVMGIVISIAIAVLVLIIAWYLCLATDVYNAHKEWYNAGEIDYQITFFQAVSFAYNYLAETDIAVAYLKDLGIGLALCAWASYSNVRSYIKAAKKQPVAPQEVVLNGQSIEQENETADIN